MKFINKRGDLSLEALLGIILSTVALILVIGVFSSFLLNEPENYKIAKSNAKSIADFVNFYLNPDNPLSHKKSCFETMKLNFLTNFQINNDNIYYLVILPTGVAVVSKKDFIKQNGQSININYFKNLKPDFKFNQPIKLVIDKTDQDSSIQFNVYGLEFGKGDSKLNLDSNENFLFLLKPVFDKTDKSNNYLFLPILLIDNLNEVNNNKELSNSYNNIKSNINKIRNTGANYDINDEGVSLLANSFSSKNQISKTSYLTFEPDKKYLFLDKGTTTDFITNSNLCRNNILIENNYLEEINKYLSMKDFSKIDYYTNKIYFTCIIKDKDGKKINEFDDNYFTYTTAELDKELCKNDETNTICKLYKSPVYENVYEKSLYNIDKYYDDLKKLCKDKVKDSGSYEVFVSKIELTDSKLDLSFETEKNIILKKFNPINYIDDSKSKNFYNTLGYSIKNTYNYNNIKKYLEYDFDNSEINKLLYFDLNTRLSDEIDNSDKNFKSFKFDSDGYYDSNINTKGDVGKHEFFNDFIISNDGKIYFFVAPKSLSCDLNENKKELSETEAFKMYYENLYSINNLFIKKSLDKNNNICVNILNHNYCLKDDCDYKEDKGCLEKFKKDDFTYYALRFPTILNKDICPFNNYVDIFFSDSQLANFIKD